MNVSYNLYYITALIVVTASTATVTFTKILSGSVISVFRSTSYIRVMTIVIALKTITHLLLE